MTYSSLKTIGTRLLIGLVCLEIAWLILGNIFLNSDTGRQVLNIKSEKFEIEWNKAWTLYPAQIHATDVRVKFHTWSSDVEAFSPRISSRVSIFPLISKRVVINDLSGHIDELKIFRDPPNKPRPKLKKKNKGAIIELRNFHIKSINSLLFNSAKVSQGEVSASGTALVQIRGDKVLQDINAKWTNASLQIDGNEISSSVNAAFEGGMSAFNPRKHKAIELARKLTGNIVVNGEISDLSPLKLLFPGVKWVEQFTGRGSVEMDVILKQGAIVSGSKIDIDANELSLDFLGFHTQGSGRVDGLVNLEEGKPNGQIRIVFDQFELVRRGIAVPLVTGEGLSLKAVTASPEIEREVPDLELTLDIPSSSVPDITIMTNYLPDSLEVSVSGGRASVTGHIQASNLEQSVSGTVQVTGDKLQGKFRNMNFQMDMAVNTQLSGQGLDDFQLQLIGTQAKLFNGTFDDEIVSADNPWWMTVDVPQGHLNLSDPMSLSADVKMAMKDTRAIIALFAEVKDWIRKFDGILTVNDVAGSANIAVSQNKLSVGDLKIEGDKLQLLAEMRANKNQSNAIVWGKLGILSLGLERTNQDTDWKLIKAKSWFKKRKAKNW